VNFVHYEVSDGVAVVTMNSPPINALGAALRADLGTALGTALSSTVVKAIVVVSDTSGFSAGADINEFGSPKQASKPLLRELQRMIETASKPVIAGIHGVALGGGLELALACAARVAVSTARLGLPEVNLGILPGAGGTQRLPRLTGPEAAIDLITTGRMVSASDALSLGIIDQLVDEVRPGALEFARKMISDGRSWERVLERRDKISNIDPAVFSVAREKVQKTMRGQAAPLAIVDCIEAACSKPPLEGLAFETEQFQILFQGTQRRALTHIFFAERAARKIPGLSPDVRALAVSAIGVVGAGSMGSGIAVAFANAGLGVILLDIDPVRVAQGLAAVERTFQTSVERGSLSEETARQALSRIRGTTRYEDLAEVDLVIEAAFENIEVKKNIFVALDLHTSPHTILGTNTSSLDIDQIASATRRPDKVVGTHFFSPANVMKLLEVVRGKNTSAETLCTIQEVGKRIGKSVVLAGNCDGFIGNRMLQFYTGSAEFLLEQGATPAQIDRVAVAFGMAMGPAAMRDLAGLDVAVMVRKARNERSPLQPGERVSPILERMVERGRLGQKAQKGFYRYEGRKKFDDPAALEVIAEVARDLGIKQRAFSDEEIRDRLFMPLVNEGAKELEDGTALRAGDIDITWVKGYGFPPYQGGPMYWGEKIGLSKVTAMAETLAAEYGSRWRPSALLRELASQGKGWSWLIAK
jgi:3-hydroxyacyl-CoA dehydrogenase